MSKLDISNQVLMLLGVEMITSFEENTINAKRLSILYDQTRKAVLREYPHTCCIKRVSLGAITSNNSYNLPDDCLRIISVNCSYELLGRSIFTTEANPMLTYIYDNKNEGTYSSGLIEALVYMLAFKLSKSILGEDGANMYTLYKNIIEQEKAVDSQQTLTQQFFSDDQFTFKSNTNY